MINPNVQATYVFGVDRNGSLPPGPFPGRPDIRFDAVVVVKLVPGRKPTASVTDLTNGKTTVLPSGSLIIAGNVVESHHQSIHDPCGHMRQRPVGSGPLRNSMAFDRGVRNPARFA